MSTTADKNNLTDQLRTKRALEAHFADNFSTLTYPMLVAIYLDEGDLTRARKVCRIGLNKHPDHVPGLYLLAVISIRDGQMVKAEGLLEQTLDLDPHHLEAAEFLVAVQERLKRSPKILAASFKRLLIANPGNNRAMARLERISAERNLVQKVKEKLRSRDQATAEDDGSDALQSEAIPPVVLVGEDADWDAHIRQVAEEIKAAKETGTLSREQAELLLESEPDELQAGDDTTLDQAAESLIDDKAGQLDELADPQTEAGSLADGLDDASFEEPGEPESMVFAERAMLEEETGDPEDALEEADAANQTPGNAVEALPDTGQADESAPDLPPQPHEPLKIDPKLATFTLATIYKVQGLFVESLEVLNMLEDKGADQERIDDEREAIRNLMESGNAT